MDKKATTGANATKKKILLVEDDSSMRRFLKVVLTRADYEVITAEDGLIALEKTKDHAFDAVLADAVMPHLSGFDLFRILRADKRYKKTPLIILSGFSNQIPDQPTDELANAYLEKDSNLGTKLPAVLEKLWKERK